jgi:hypothetical protein
MTFVWIEKGIKMHITIKNKFLIGPMRINKLSQIELFIVIKGL